MLREAQAMAQLSHPNVAEVYDVELVGGIGLVLAMELVDGGTLKGWLGEADRPWNIVLEAFMAAGRGLAAAHRAGLLHRDFKPANVLVSEDGRFKVTDFGLAMPVESTDGLSSHPSGRVRTLGETEAGAVMGTPRYMAPEQHTGEPLDTRADQYAFCVALWEGLTGTPPFRTPHAKLDGPPPWPRTGTSALNATPKPVARLIS